MSAGLETLSAREGEVLDALSERLTNAEIAARLFISVRTVESHVSALLRKLGASDRRALAAVAREHRLAAPPSWGTPAASTTRFVGRSRELDELTELIGRERLVTITGPGGAGKTRLATEFAARIHEGFADGVAFVELASLRDPLLVGATVAAAVGVRAEPGESIVDAVASYLAARHALIVLDNCEHVAAAAADLVQQLVAGTARVSVLTTSREPLRLRVEAVVALGPLRVARAGEAPELMDESPAAELFADRAATVDRDFRITSDNRSLVRDLCSAVDGLPLAIELAAVRLAQLPLAELTSSLQTSLALLDEGPRDLPERHRTLRATVDWSYQLLERPAQALFERLSVFAGRFSLEAAEMVGGFDPIGPADVVGHVAGLVSKSLVVREGDAYRLLEPVRQFAAEQLAAGPHRIVAADRHLEYFVSLTERLGVGLTTAGTPDELDVLRHNESNVRAALAWAFDQPRSDAHALGARLVGASVWRWFVDGLIDEGSMWTDRALEATKAADVDLRLLALYGRASVSLAQADVVATLNVGEEMQRLAHSPEHDAFLAFASDLRGNALWIKGDLVEAEAQLAESVEIASRIGLLWHAAFARAELARIVFDLGDRPRAAELAARAVTTATAVGEPMSIGFALDVSAVQALASGAIDAAAALVEESLTQYQRIGYREGIASATQLLARLALARGETGVAHARLTEVLRLHRLLGHRGGLAAAFETLALLCAAVDDHEHAAMFLGQADVLRRQAAVPVTPSELPTIDAARRDIAERLGAQFDSAVRRGTLLDLDAAIALASAFVSGAAGW